MLRLMDLCRHAAGKTALAFVGAAALVALIHFLPGFDQDALALHIRDKGARGVILYIAATAVGSAVGFPRQGLSFVGGYVFGALSGVVFATIGTTLGCAGGFFLTRFLGRPFLPKRFAERMEGLDAFLAKAPFSMALTVRCMPFGNNALTNVVAGLSSIPPLGFIAGSCIGYIPQNLIFSLLGSGMRVDPFWRVASATVLFLLSLALGIFLFIRHRASFSVAEKKRGGPF